MDTIHQWQSGGSPQALNVHFIDKVLNLTKWYRFVEKPRRSTCCLMGNNMHPVMPESTLGLWSSIILHTAKSDGWARNQSPSSQVKTVILGWFPEDWQHGSVSQTIITCSWPPVKNKNYGMIALYRKMPRMYTYQVKIVEVQSTR